MVASHHTSAHHHEADTMPERIMREDETMHIAQLIQYLEVGGLERMALSLSEGLVNRGHRVTVISYLSEDGPMRKAFERCGVEVVRLSKRDGFDVSLIARIARVLEERGVDLLHTHHLGPYMYGSAAAKCAAVELVHTEHSHELYDEGRRALVGATMDAVAKVVAVTPEIARWRQEAFGVSCEVVRNGVALPTPSLAARSRSRALLDLELGDYVIGCVARLSPEKDHVTMLRAFERTLARCPRAKLVLVGDGPERGALELAAHDLDLGDSVRFLGRRSDVETLLPGFDVIALSSIREGLPLALLEGMARGLPVVATAVGGVPELLVDGGGSLAPAGDVDAFARALCWYGNEPLRRTCDGRRAREIVSVGYSADVMTGRYAQLYADALGVTLQEVA